MTCLFPILVFFMNDSHLNSVEGEMPYCCHAFLLMFSPKKKPLSAIT